MIPVNTKSCTHAWELYRVSKKTDACHIQISRELIAGIFLFQSGCSIYYSKVFTCYRTVCNECTHCSRTMFSLLYMSATMHCYISLLIHIIHRTCNTRIKNLSFRPKFLRQNKENLVLIKSDHCFTKTKTMI